MEEEEEEKMRMRRRRRDYSNRDVDDDDDDDYYDEQEIEGEGEGEERVLEWEEGLPSADDLTPLSQHLISPQLASAFSIKPQPISTMLDVNRATHKTLSTLLLLLLHTTTTTTTTSSRRRRIRRRRRSTHHHSPKIKTNNHNQNHEEEEEEEEEDPTMVVVEGEHHDDDEDEDRPCTPPTKDGSETRKIQRRRRVLLEDEEEDEEEENNTNTEEVDSGFRTDDDHSARTLKRARLVWTPQLHKRFVDVVAHLSIKNAVPKTIMQLMNVQGLTRENVASHLQKYRLYLKRMQGLSNEGPSSSSVPFFASTPVPHSLHDPPPTGRSTSGKQLHFSHPPLPPPPPMPYGGNMLPMPVLGHGFGNPAAASASAAAAAAYQGFEFHPYGMFRDQQRDWSGNRFGPMVSYPKASK